MVTHDASTRTGFRFVSAAAAILLLGGCPDPPVGSVIQNTAKETADDGDDTDGLAATNNDKGYAQDGGSLAVSEPLGSSQFFVIATAQVGRNAKRVARANPLGETVSVFRID